MTNAKKIESCIHELLNALGEDSTREGLIQTPERVARSLKFLTKGYEENPYDVVRQAMFCEKIDEMVLVKDIEIYSLCEHHLLPFYGRAHVAYVPDQKIIGLSKIARVVEIYARRLQVQERLTKQVAQTLLECLQPKGVAVVISAAHMCMQMRGVQKHKATMVTSTMLGYFKSSLATRTEFMDMIKGSL